MQTGKQIALMQNKKHRPAVFLLLLVLFSLSLNAQLNKVIIEKYYISDANDATDTTGSVLPANSTTYRIYIAMLPGYKLTKVFGNSQHQWKIASDSVFYNHTLDGQTFANNFNIVRYQEGTVPLDTWLALGQVSTLKPNGKTYYGTPKAEDRDGSLVGGKNNDGGSQGIAGGLLINNDTAAGIPLTTSDGLDTMASAPSGWSNYGILDAVSGNDSTIFGSIKKGKQFVSNNAFIFCDGITGVNRDSNQVLIAQLTTRGKISFALNVEMIDANNMTYRYVAKNGSDSLDAGVFESPYLTYPLPCGCTDPNYMEYSSAYGCPDSAACKTLAVLGCMDSLACNYNPQANVPVQSICCYPGYCNDRDISLVCPDLLVKELQNPLYFSMSPNPVSESLNIRLSYSSIKPLSCEIFDATGKLIFRNLSISVNASEPYPLSVSEYANGIYLLRLSTDEYSFSRLFVKTP
jgi:hypothetical protein